MLRYKGGGMDRKCGNQSLWGDGYSTPGPVKGFPYITEWNPFGHMHWEDSKVLSQRRTKA